MIDRHRRLLTKLNPDPVLSAALGKADFWLHNTAASGAIASVADLRASNPATQTVAGRKPTGAAGSSIAFDGGDTLVFPVTAANATASKWWLATWVKPTSLGTLQIFFSSYVVATSLARIELYWQGTGKVAMSIYSDGVTGRNAIATSNGSLATGTPAFVVWAFDSAGATEADKCHIYVDGADIPLTFSGVGTITTLPVVTGNHIIGGRGNLDTPVAPVLNGTVIGQDIWGGATVLTPLERAALRAYAPLA